MAKLTNLKREKVWQNSKLTKVCNKTQVAVNETVKHCYRPLVSDCDVEGKPILVQPLGIGI